MLRSAFSEMLKPPACPQCDSPDVEAVTPRPYQPQSTWYHCRACERIWSIPQPPTILH
jgi:hypothetical protein